MRAAVVSGRTQLLHEKSSVPVQGRDDQGRNSDLLGPHLQGKLACYQRPNISACPDTYLHHPLRGSTDM